MSDLKRVSEGRFGQILTVIGAVLAVYFAISDLLRGSVTVLQVLESTMIIIVFLVVLFATLWPEGDDVIARKTEALEPYLSAVFVVIFSLWAGYLWTSDSENTFLFYLLLLGVVVSVVELLRRTLPTDKPYRPW